MRLLGCLFITLYSSAVIFSAVTAQPADEHRPDETASAVHKHRDHHHGHDHIYPDRGSILHELPRGAIPVNYAGFSYSVSEGVWLEARGHAFVVVTPAIGAVVLTLPAFATPIEHGGQNYLYANDVFYVARPDLGGYEVVNDPDEVISPAPALAESPTAAATAAASPLANTAPPANTADPANVASAAVSTTAVASTPAPGAAPADAVPAHAPPSGAAPVTSSPAASSTTNAVKAVANPKNGQSPEVQARDRYECYQFAVKQSGFDPIHASGSSGAAQAAAQQADYERAQAACFEGRGYAVP